MYIPLKLTHCFILNFFLKKKKRKKNGKERKGLGYFSSAKNRKRALSDRMMWDPLSRESHAY